MQGHRGLLQPSGPSEVACTSPRAGCPPQPQSLPGSTQGTPGLCQERGAGVVAATCSWGSGAAPLHKPSSAEVLGLCPFQNSVEVRRRQGRRGHPCFWVLGLLPQMTTKWLRKQEIPSHGLEALKSRCPQGGLPVRLWGSMLPASSSFGAPRPPWLVAVPLRLCLSLHVASSHVSVSPLSSYKDTSP